MKLSTKVLGATTLLSAASFFYAYLHNCAEWEKQERLMLIQNSVYRYNPQKYDELFKKGCYDLDVWEKTEAELRDSVEAVRRIENDSIKAYFVGGRNANDSLLKK